MKLFFIALLILCITSSPALAENNRINKLARGVVNIVTAPLEIQKQTYEYWKMGNEKTKYVGVWIFSGFVKGHVNMIGRLCSGLWDVLTFSIPVPSEYESLIQPDYVYEIKENN